MDQPNTFRLKLGYFLLFSGMATMVPWFQLLYETRGLDGGRMGLLLAMPSIALVLAAPVWSSLADITHRHKLILLALILGSILFICGLLMTSSFKFMLPMVIGYSICFTPMMSFIDNLSLHNLGKKSAEIGKLRLWGSVGWVLITFPAGFLLDQMGLVPVIIAGLFFYLLLILALLGQTDWPQSIGGNFWEGARGMVRNPNMIRLLFLVFIHGAGLNLLFTFYILHLKSLGFHSIFMAAVIVTAALSEIPVMLLSRRLLRQWGANRLLLCAFVFLAIRSFAFAFCTQAWSIILIQLLHGPTFGMMWVGSITRAHELSPRGMGTTGQSLVSGFNYGLGWGIGALIAGVLYDMIGTGQTYVWTGVVLTVLIPIMLLCGFHRREAKPDRKRTG
jgi:MFS family permease